MSGKVVFRNIMSIILLGVDTVISDRTSQTYGQLLEKAVHLSLEIIVLVLEKDLLLADFWRPLYQVWCNLAFFCMLLKVISDCSHCLIIAALGYYIISRS